MMIFIYFLFMVTLYPSALKDDAFLLKHSVPFKEFTYSDQAAMD